MRKVSNAGNWFIENWPILAIAGVIFASVALFAWIIVVPPPAPPYP